ncbi:MAG: M2 family metallopeptidase [Candidatus Latescibacterota bacterium]|nr:MAG: M2 family metallopeptidase [Candidatus Latescibacterota bacterium]
MMDLATFLEAHLRVVEPLSRDINLAYWNATISGDPNDFERYATLQLRVQKIYSNPDEFDLIRKWKDDPRITGPLERRQVDLLYNDYLRNQIDPALNEQITKLSSKIENQFSTHRATLDGREVTSNDIHQILKQSTDAELRKKAWQAGKVVGGIVESDLLRLVKLRNEAAECLGYDNYYTMSLDLNEQNESAIVGLFDEIDDLTNAPFEKQKQEIDEKLAMRYGLKVADLRPWHYDDPFFQEAPKVLQVDLDKYYHKTDILELVSMFFRGIGLDLDDVLARSDLYEKPGKDQHAYCTDIDRKGDIRILANIKNDENWTATMLHELGHAAYDKHIDGRLPFLLRHQAHIFTTEAVAMMFGRLSKDGVWIRDALGIPDENERMITATITELLKMSQLIFARWALVMMNFERALYADPGQNLNELWWALVDRYQLLTPPDEPDFPYWAAKSHVVSAPVYYHNYLLGEILASQFTAHIREHVFSPTSPGRSFYGHPEIGDYLREMIFKPGARFRWDTMIEKATGEPLTPKHFVEQFMR